MKEVAHKTTITLQLDDEVRRRLERRASREGRALESEAAELLGAAVGIVADDGPQNKEGIERFIGMWTKEEAEEFNRFLFTELRRIDPEMWE